MVAPGTDEPNMSIQRTNISCQEVKTIASWNIHLQNAEKRESFVSFISSQSNIQLCGVVETWLNDSDILMAKQLENTDFEWIGNDRKGTRGGGVGFMVKGNLNPSKVLESKDGNELWISIGLKDKWYVGIVYITPTEKDYETRLQNLQQNVFKFAIKGRVIIMGDFNARVGELPNIIPNDSSGEEKYYNRSSLDKICNARGKSLMESLNAANLLLLNGMDSIAKFTSHQMAGSATIDFVWTLQADLNIVRNLTVWNDHPSIE